jgi:hypothetical protein
VRSAVKGTISTGTGLPKLTPVEAGSRRRGLASRWICAHGTATRVSLVVVAVEFSGVVVVLVVLSSTVTADVGEGGDVEDPVVPSFISGGVIIPVSR